MHVPSVHLLELVIVNVRDFIDANGYGLPGQGEAKDQNKCEYLRAQEVDRCEADYMVDTIGKAITVEQSLLHRLDMNGFIHTAAPADIPHLGGYVKAQ
jgi:hypothetical protein